MGKDKLEGYGRITWKRPNTMRGHYFWDLIVAKPVSIHHILRYQMKDMFIIFQMIPHSLILTEWFGHSALPKKGGFWHFPANGKNFQAPKIIFLDIFFQTTVIRWKIYLEPSNQLQMATNIPNFHNMKEAKW